MQKARLLFSILKQFNASHYIVYDVHSLHKYHFLTYKRALIFFFHLRLKERTHQTQIFVIRFKRLGHYNNFSCTHSHTSHLLNRERRSILYSVYGVRINRVCVHVCHDSQRYWIHETGFREENGT